jgi:error-prone DNA polymerase
MRIRDDAAWLRARFPAGCVAGGGTASRRRRCGACALLALAVALGIPAGGQRRRAHARAQPPRALQDTMTAIRLRTTWPRPARACSRTASATCARDRRWRRSIRGTAGRNGAHRARCTFDLRQLEYEYPRELVPAGTRPRLAAQLTEDGIALRWRWPDEANAPRRAS